MMKRFITIVIILAPTLGFSQSLNLNFLFKPGVTVGGEYTAPASFNDSSTFQINKYRAQVTLPLKTKLGVDLKKLDLKASQTFFAFNGSLREPNFSNSAIQNQGIYTVSTGVTHLTAGIRNGIWLYSGNVYMSESSKTIGSKPQINALGYIARIRLNNLKFIYFYGAAAVYNFGRFIPVPIGGFTTKLHRKWRLTAVLPVQLKLTYKIKPGHSLDFGTTFSGVNAVYRNSNDVFMNYRQLKNHVVFNSKISSKFNLSVEGGLSAWRRIDFFGDSDSDLLNFNVKPAFYCGINLNYTFGKSLLNMKLEGID